MPLTTWAVCARAASIPASSLNTMKANPRDLQIFGECPCPRKSGTLFKSSTFNILHTPASHGIHLQVDVLNVAKGAEVFLDVCVLCLLRRIDIEVKISTLIRNQLFSETKICYYTLSTTKHGHFSRLEKAMISMAPLRGCNFTEKIQLRTRCL